ncbi:hypothetical protein ACSFC1_07110 [Pseudothermotoga sp. U03pept]|uniref:hypothetical protein n=1 Tax=Pseudothermotoga sp. U03pept TaxID=3447012 RepID=UPI003F12297F
MKAVLLVAVIAGLLILAGCQPFLPSGATKENLAKDLLESVIDILGEELPDPDSSPTELLELVKRFIYIPEGDENDSEVIEGALDIGGLVLVLNFSKPATAVDFTVLSVVEHDVKSIPPYIINDPPAFVDKVYRIIAQLQTEDSTITSISLPMITIVNETKAYFFTVFIGGTGSATELLHYPKLQPIF